MAVRCITITGFFICTAAFGQTIALSKNDSLVQNKVAAPVSNVDTMKYDSCLVFSSFFTVENDGIRVIYNCEIIKFHIDIYNRWGEKLYKSDSLDSYYLSLPEERKRRYSTYLGWDYSKQPEDKYYYVIKYTIKTDGKENERWMAGWVTFIK